MVFPCIWEIEMIAINKFIQKSCKDFSYLTDCSICSFSLRECDEASAFLNLHWHVHNLSEFWKMSFQEVFGDCLPRHINSVTSFRLLSTRCIWFLVAILFFFKLLVQEWNWPISTKIVWETFPMVSDEIFTRQVSRSAAVTSMRSCLLQSKMMSRMDDRRRVLALPSSFALDLSDATIKLKFNLTRWSTKCCQLP